MRPNASKFYVVVIVIVFDFFTSFWLFRLFANISIALWMRAVDFVYAIVSACKFAIESNKSKVKYDICDLDFFLLSAVLYVCVCVCIFAQLLPCNFILLFLLILFLVLHLISLTTTSVSVSLISLTTSAPAFFPRIVFFFVFGNVNFILCISELWLMKF